MSSLESYQEWLRTMLEKPGEASSYLNEALRLGDSSVFLLAIKDVIESRTGGMDALANEMRVTKTTLLKILCEKENPDLTGLDNLLDALGFKIVIEEKDKLQ